MSSQRQNVRAASVFLSLLSSRGYKAVLVKMAKTAHAWKCVLNFNLPASRFSNRAKDVILLVVGTVTCATLPGRVPEAMPRQRTPRDRARISVSRPSRLCPGRRRLSSVPRRVFCCRMLSYGVCRVRMQFVCGAGREAGEHEAFCVFIGMTYERSSQTCRLHWVLPAWKVPRWPDDLVEGFDAGLAVGMIALFWQQRLLGLSCQ